MLRQLVVFVFLTLIVSSAHAQSSRLLEAIEILDPTLTASVTLSTEYGDCTWPPGDLRNYPCEFVGERSFPLPLADGSFLNMGGPYSNEIVCGEARHVFETMVRIMPDNTVTAALRLVYADCLECDGGVCVKRANLQRAIPWVDTTNGRLHLFVTYEIRDSTNTGILYQEKGRIVVSGFPQMFDTMLTFVPGGQAISAVTPRHPDGFRSADSLRVWTGNLRSMPDWSQAQPLTCEASVSPTPGQVVSVPDTLPDPAVGEGRYYLVASQSGADRRLGRQYVNGAFSARQPAGLPACQ